MLPKTREYRVLNLLKRPSKRGGFTLRQIVVRKLLVEYPAAQRVRFAGKCPDCKSKNSFVSFQFAEDIGTNDAGWEHCGYFCASCKWGNAGSRLVVTR